MRRNRTGVMLLLAIGLCVYLLVAACKGDDDNAATQTTTPTGASTTTGQGTGTAAATSAPSATASADEVVELVKDGYTETFTDTPAGRFGSFGCGVLLHNKSKTEGVVQADWSTTFFDASGANVGGTYGYVYNMLPEETRGADSCGGQVNPPAAQIARMETTIHVCSTCWTGVATTKRFSATVTLDRSNATVYQGSGTATNPFTTAINQGFVELLYFNAAGDVIGGGGAHFDSIPAGGTIDWTAQVYVNFSDNSSIDHVEAYVAPESVTKIEDLK
ncbi:MAG: hypothetical protein ABI559_06740 [Chloroflexota bacterium]